MDVDSQKPTPQNKRVVINKLESPRKRFSMFMRDEDDNDTAINPLKMMRPLYPTMLI